MCIHPTVRVNSDFGFRISDSRSAAGFTLLEVIIGLALISILIGGVYGVASATIGLGKSMADSRVGETRVTNFVSQWREYLETLPADTRFHAGDTIRFEGGGIPFTWHRLTRRADAVEFEMKNHSLIVRHLKRPRTARSPDEFRVLAEMPLLEGLRVFRCEYYEQVEKKWFSVWDLKKRPQAPLFMRMRFGFEGEKNDHEFTFWMANDLVPQTPPASDPQSPPLTARP
jgi:prepilin-type N-terminal cleavage/methylation domain-containing protein